jgi:hypothetical protein
MDVDRSRIIYCKTLTINLSIPKLPKPFRFCPKRTFVVPGIEDSNQVLQDLKELSTIPDNT